MIRTDPWQSEAVIDFQNMLAAHNDVVVLALFGSATPSGRAVDKWSDVDFLLVIEDQAYSWFYPSVEWLGEFGEIFTAEHSENSFHGTTRVCFADFRRLDLVITTESKLKSIDEWTRIPFWNGLNKSGTH